MLKKNLTDFIKLCLKANEEAILTELFDLFLTPEEKENIGLRVLVIEQLLAKNATQREISQALQVSIAKITRGSNELKRMSPRLLDFLKKQMKQLNEKSGATSKQSH